MAAMPFAQRERGRTGHPPAQPSLANDFLLNCAQQFPNTRI